MTRRAFFSLAAAGPKRYRVGIIGHTGRGNYGHGMDTVWRTLPNMDVAAVADPDEKGRAAAQARSGARAAYADYREMLRREKPEIVAVGPRWMDQRVPMVTAAVEAGAHVYMEKPFALTLAEADRIVDAVRRAGVKLQIAHQMRRTPYALRAKAMLEAGEIGEVEEIRARGKEDRRAGGEDLMVLGSHLVDMMRFFLGDPAWVTAHVTVAGREMSAADVRQPGEPVGPVAGTQIEAAFAFANGVHGHLATRAVADTHPLRFGTWIYGSKGVLFLPNAIYPEGGLHVLRTPAWLPDERHRWAAIPLPPARPGGATEIANGLMVEDLVRAIETNGRPACDEEDGRWTIEMIHGVYRAQQTGGRVRFPLASRRHPLDVQ